MNEFFLKKLVVSGKDVKESVIEFKNGVNIIAGPSNTGKTCIKKSIDFIFGSKEKPFSDSWGYDTIVLAVSYCNSEIIFKRLLSENKISVVSESADIASGIYGIGNGKKNINKIWLKLIGIDNEHFVVKNSKFDVQRLTWRSLLNFFLIDERKIDCSESIWFAGNYVAKTALQSSLLFLITGKDFNDIQNEMNITKKAGKIVINNYIAKKIEYINNERKHITDLNKDFDLNRIENNFVGLTNQLSSFNNEIDEYLSKEKELASKIVVERHNIVKYQLQRKRFEVLKQQYVADIKKLSFAVEGEEAVNSFKRNEKCPYCNNILTNEISKKISISAGKEIPRIYLLLNDLNKTIHEMDSMISESKANIRVLESQITYYRDIVEKELLPKSENVKEKLSIYKKAIETSKELEMLEHFKTVFEADCEYNGENANKPKPYKASIFFDSNFWKDFSIILSDMLNKCYFRFNTVELSQENFDIVIDGKIKSENYGKGYCSFLNTIVTLALRKYFCSHNKNYSSIYIIDTPLHGLDDVVDDKYFRSQAKALFEYVVDTNDLGQLIIFENTKFLPNINYANEKINYISFLQNNDGRNGFLWQ